MHIDIKYLPQMPDETSRHYLFVAIDRATRWVYIELNADQTDSRSVDFLAKVRQACPVKIVKLLTDNGSQFTDRFTAGGKKKEFGGTHVFDRLCKQFGIEHRLIPPRHPQTNGIGRAVQWPRQRHRQPDTFPFSRRPGIDAAQLRQDS